MSEFNPNVTYNEIVFSEEWKKHRGELYHAYRREWDLWPRDKRRRDMPIHLDIETTTKCNLLCPMCPRTQMLDAGTFGNADGYMTREEYQSVIDQAVAGPVTVRSIKLNYLGEPLLHPDVYWQVEYAKSVGIVDVIMNTNGTALTEKNARKLLEAGVDGVFVSIDAISPRLYEQQRVGTTLGRVVDNVYAFRRLRDELRPGCQLRVSMVMYDDPIWREQFNGLVAMFRDVADAVGWGEYVDHTDVPAGVVGDGVDQGAGEDFWCAQLWQRMFIKQNGNVTVCCVDSADELKVGDWRTQSLSDIWRGDLYQSLRDMHAAGRYHEIPACARCYLPCAHRKEAA